MTTNINAYPTAIPEVSMSAGERAKRLKDTLRTMQILSSMAGKELPIRSQIDLADIPHEPGVYLLSDYADKGGEISDVNFELEPVLISGVADSAHSVIAGDLHVSRKGKGGIDATVSVAAKCYSKRTPEERFERAKRELIIMGNLKDEGEVAFEPIAMIIAPQGASTDNEVVILTRYNPEILSLDNHPWGRGPTDEDNTHTALSAAGTLGRFNKRGYLHGDAKIKNVATSGDGVHMIDFETSVVIDPTLPTDAAYAARRDFETLVDSLGKRGFLGSGDKTQAGNGQSWEEQLHLWQQQEAVRNTINGMAEEYLSAWSESGEDVQEAVVREISNITATYINN